VPLEAEERAGEPWSRRRDPTATQCAATDAASVSAAYTLRALMHVNQAIRVHARRVSGLMVTFK